MEKQKIYQITVDGNPMHHVNAYSKWHAIELAYSRSF